MLRWHTIDTNACALYDASLAVQVPREYPFDNLKEELGGFDPKGSTKR